MSQRPSSYKKDETNANKQAPGFYTTNCRHLCSVVVFIFHRKFFVHSCYFQDITHLFCKYVFLLAWNNWAGSSAYLSFSAVISELSPCEQRVFVKCPSTEPVLFLLVRLATCRGLFVAWVHSSDTNHASVLPQKAKLRPIFESKQRPARCVEPRSSGLHHLMFTPELFINSQSSKFVDKHTAWEYISLQNIFLTNSRRTS